MSTFYKERILLRSARMARMGHALLLRGLDYMILLPCRKAATGAVRSRGTSTLNHEPHFPASEKA